MTWPGRLILNVDQSKTDTEYGRDLPVHWPIVLVDILTPYVMLIPSLIRRSIPFLPFYSPLLEVESFMFKDAKKNAKVLSRNAMLRLLLERRTMEELQNDRCSEKDSESFRAVAGSKPKWLEQLGKPQGLRRFSRHETIVWLESPGHLWSRNPFGIWWKLVASYALIQRCVSTDQTEPLVIFGV